ncbi:MAG: LysM peptidoglycan-binding domain-containing protein [Anaerolineae bacterium]|nr:LysM peptidoglycan-binding domain-containing protein [Candidatus Roseilinea sp.]MDW8450770.1 LysM peptidoglycan-binding domain-containing protein [Anaerolineae bacterium]
MCEICGHEFGTTQAIPRAQLEARSVAEQRPPRNRPRPSSTSRLAQQHTRSPLAQIPWGVIGVVAVIAFVIVGALLLAQGIGLTQASPEPTVEVVIQDPAATENGVIAGGPQLPATPTPTAEPPTATPASSPTPIPPREYTVQFGDTCSGIAQRFTVRLDELAALNNLDTERCLIRAGDKLLIPVPSPTPLPTATLLPGAAPPQTAASAPGEPTATLPAQIVYVVKGGDTCSEIAQKFNVTVELLMQQNNLDTNCLIRMNQVLTITFATPTPTLVPTPFVLQTPTPRAGYNAPIVMLPADGAQISGTQEIVTLQWLTVGLLQENEWYVVQVQPSGAITVPIFETKATSLKLTQDILGDWEEREIAWWVQVKRFVGIEPGTGQRVYVEVSPPSAARAFVWRRRPASTATPSP